MGTSINKCIEVMPLTKDWISKLSLTHLQTDVDVDTIICFQVVIFRYTSCAASAISVARAKFHCLLT